MSAPHPANVVVRGVTIGCSVRPTPLDPLSRLPHPNRCLRGNGVVGRACGLGAERRATPISAPFGIARARGALRPIELTIQAAIEDSGAANPLGLSVTNAVTVIVR